MVRRKFALVLTLPSVGPLLGEEVMQVSATRLTKSRMSCHIYKLLAGYN